MICEACSRIQNLLTCEQGLTEQKSLEKYNKNIIKSTKGTNIKNSRQSIHILHDKCIKYEKLQCIVKLYMRREDQTMKYFFGSSLFFVIREKEERI